MIPKIIHYCWFGKNELPDMAKKCIESWKKYCPDYEIIEWNEDNFDVNHWDYTREAYEAKKWAFVSDVARLYALVNYGGVYMDTDVEVIKPIDELLAYEAFSGLESETHITTGIMACEKRHKMFVELLEEYNDIHFVRSDGSLDLITNVTRITNSCCKYGFVPNNQLQTINGFTILPRDYLCPKDYETKEVNITKNSYVIHHFDGSWHSDEDEYVTALSKKMKWLPKGVYFARFIGVIKYEGIKAAYMQTIGWFNRNRK